MKVLLELAENIKKSDVLIYEEDKIVGITQNSIIKKVEEENEALKKEIELLKEELTSLKTQLNSKLKEYHDLLKLLSKGE